MRLSRVVFCVSLFEMRDGEDCLGCFLELRRGHGVFAVTQAVEADKVLRCRCEVHAPSGGGVNFVSFGVVSEYVDASQSLTCEFTGVVFKRTPES